jgi:aerobic carbon-monoxide dehydrogenase small subunit
MKPPTVPVTFTLNGQSETIDVQPHHTLLEVLRDRLHLTGTKECCSEGECGACTVLVDGRSACSCLVLAAEASGRSVTTIEGLAAHGALDPLQAEFVTKGAVQCGFCIPGMVMSAKYLLLTNPDPTEADIQEALVGNLCRCGGYHRIVEAVSAAARAK